MIGRFLGEGEGVVIPRHSPGVVFGHNHQPPPRIYHLPESGPRGIKSLGVRVLDQPGLCKSGGYVIRRGMVFDNDNQRLAWVFLQPTPNSLQFGGEWSGAALALQVAKVELPLAAGVQVALVQLLSRPHGGLAQLLHQSQPVCWRCRGHVGHHHRRALRFNARVKVNQQTPVSGFQLGDDSPGMVGQHEPVLGAGHCVMSGRNGNVIQPPVAQLQVAVAAGACRDSNRALRCSGAAVYGEISQHNDCRRRQSADGRQPFQHGPADPDVAAGGSLQLAGSNHPEEFSQGVDQE